MQYEQRGHTLSTEKETLSYSDEDFIANLMEQHDQFVDSMRARLAKLEVSSDKAFNFPLDC